MIPFKVKLTVYRGATFRWKATLKNGDPAVPTDLTGYTARMQIRPDVESSRVLADLTTENGGIVLGGAAGTIELFIPAAVTTPITDSIGVHDLEMIAPNGDVIRRMVGAVVFVPEVTR